MRRTITFTIPCLVLALLIGVTASAAQKKAAAKTMTATGIVKSVAASSLVVNSNGKDWNFMIDSATNVVGKGAGTAAKQKGGKPMINDLVMTGDRVTVTYHDMGGSMHAAKVTVTAKAAKK